MAENNDDVEENLELHSRPPADTCETTLDMLTWNTHGPGPAGSANLRHAIIPIVKKLLNKETLAFLQELYSRIAVEKWGFEVVAASVIKGGKLEAGVSTPRSAKLEISDRAEDILSEDRLKDLKVEEVFRSRMYGRIVTIKHKIGSTEYSSKIVALSFHARYKVSEKSLEIMLFFDEMIKLANNMRKTIIIGGDFNIHVSQWKYDVETKYPGQVIVARYKASPRRRDRLIDTFARVHPTSEADQTPCSFKKTTALYPFPVDRHVGGNETGLEDYPSTEKVWYKYIHYSKSDRDEVEKLLRLQENKREIKSPAGATKKTVAQNGTKEETAATDSLTQSFKRLAMDHSQAMPPPAPLWPNSPLHQVLDHDPVLTTITFTLKRKESGDESGTGTTPTSPSQGAATSQGN